MKGQPEPEKQPATSGGGVDMGRDTRLGEAADVGHEPSCPYALALTLANHSANERGW